MKLRTFTALAMAALIGGSTLGAVAFAQTPMPMDEDPLDDRSRKRLDRMEKVVRELRSIVFQGRETGVPVVVQPADTAAQMQSMAQRISDLETSLQRLNGQNETLAHELQQARGELAAFQGRIAPLESAAAAEALAAEQEAARAAEDPDVVFANATGLLNGGDYDGAEAALADFVERHPDHAKAGEANYMLGQAYGVRGAHSDAAAAYVASIRGYPKTGWAPDAMVELSRTLLALKRTDDACRALATLGEKYPKPSAAVAKKAAATRTQAKCAA